MKGYVEVYRGETLIDEGQNFIVDGAASVICDAFTAPRSLQYIESASAILDTSNYVVNAMTFGKDAEGYNRSAHSSDVAAAVSADGIIRVVNTGDVNTSTYNPEDQDFDILPEAFHPLHTRLEFKPTETTTAPDGSAFDLGHNANAMKTMDDNWKALIGCFPPATGVDFYVIDDPTTPNTAVTSGTITGYWNNLGVLSEKGFLFRGLDDSGDAPIASPSALNVGLDVATFFTQPKLWYSSFLRQGDYVSNSIFGGIFNLGLWSIDIKKTIENGFYPPYSMSDIDNLEFKLFARKTFVDNLLRGSDSGSSSSYAHILTTGTTAEQGILIKWGIYF